MILELFNGSTGMQEPGRVSAALSTDPRKRGGTPYPAAFFDLQIQDLKRNHRLGSVSWMIPQINRELELVFTSVNGPWQA
jgi:hypothetical protein